MFRVSKCYICYNVHHIIPLVYFNTYLQNNKIFNAPNTIKKQSWSPLKILEHIISCRFCYKLIFLQNFIQFKVITLHAQLPPLTMLKVDVQFDIKLYFIKNVSFLKKSMKFEMLFKSMLPSNFIGRRGLVLIRTMKKVFKYQF